MPNIDPYVEQVLEAVLAEVNDVAAMPVECVSNGLRTVVRQVLVDAADHGAAGREQIVEGLLASDDNMEVSQCGECPFFEHIDDHRGCGDACVAPQLKSFRSLGKDPFAPPPEWCPLRVATMRILLAEGT